MKNIIIMGARGYHKKYGGWETFVSNLIDNYNDPNVKFYVPEITNDKNEVDEVVNGVVCHKIYVPKSGNAAMFIFAIKALYYYTSYIKKNKLKNVVLYILGARLGPLLTLERFRLKRLGVTIIMNPDGLEWKRSKWNFFIRQCFKMSEWTMVKASDYVVCDSKSIKKYIDKKYKVDSKFIAYGADQYLSNKKDVLKKYNLKSKNYYLIVGRFVPENNYELVLKEFMKSKTNKDLIIITNLSKNKFYKKLEETTNFTSDKRIKFIGSIYDKDELYTIRKNAYAYIHGHSAGGTNPSLLEALSITDLNILYNVEFNKEVGLDSCYYFDEKKPLSTLINKLDKLNNKEIEQKGMEAKKRIKDEYTWDIVVNKYKELFKDL
jgi:rhamnosyltransferase